MEEENWPNFDDDDDALSLSNLPVTTEGGANGKEDGDEIESEDVFNEFEFFKYEEKMCVADEVFFQGRMVVPTMSNGGVCSGSRSESSKSFYFTHPSPKPYLPSKQPRRTTQARQNLQTPTVGNFRFGAGRNYWRNRLSCQWCSVDEGPIEPRRKEKQQLQVFSPSIPRRSHGDRLF